MREFCNLKNAELSKLRKQITDLQFIVENGKKKPESDTDSKTQKLNLI